MSITSRRAALETPYDHEYRESVARSMDAGRPPRDFPSLLQWFLKAWADEIPPNLHGSSDDVWRDFGESSVGGSTLGTPRYSDPFRQYIESDAYPLGNPYQTDARRGEDQNGAVYVRPVHRALHRMSAGDSGRLHRNVGVRPFMARYLFALACSGGDWHSTAARFGIAPQVAPLYTEKALERLWGEYERIPRSRSIA